MGDNVTMTAEASVAPEDLCDKAIKLARRVQSLRDGRLYHITLVKGRDQWHLKVDAESGKLEALR
jgi:hypothetical protein